MKIEISNKKLKELLFKKEITEIKKLKEEIVDLKTQLKKIEQIAKTPNCQKCGSSNVIKNGSRPTQRRGEIQKFKCLECGHRFSTDTSFGYRMRNQEKTIKQALKLRKQGNSLAKIAEKIGGNVTRQTILRWLQKYQPPTEEKTIKVKQKNQYGEYERNFKIKI